MIDRRTGLEVPYELIVSQVMEMFSLNRATAELMIRHCEEKTGRGNIHLTRKSAVRQARMLSASKGEWIEAFHCRVCSLYHIGKRVHWRKKV